MTYNVFGGTLNVTQQHSSEPNISRECETTDTLSEDMSHINHFLLLNAFDPIHFCFCYTPR